MGLWWYYTKWSDQSKRQILQDSTYEVSKLIKTMETENIIVVVKISEEEESENCCLMGVGLQACRRGKFYRLL